MKFRVSEKFRSIQGEGSTMGRPSIFLRLGGCNLMCGGWGTQNDRELHNGATWRCDTIEVWMKASSTPIEDVLDPEDLGNLNLGDRLIITGGEPLLVQDKIIHFLRFLQEEHDLDPSEFVEIETNGTILPHEDLIPLVNQWNVSPKLSNSGMKKEIRMNKEVIQKFNSLDNAIFKMVISDQDDLTEFLQDEYYDLMDDDKVWLMPSGETREEILRLQPEIAELSKFYNFNLSSRLHILLWDKKTGV